jgi:hypothetical protein
MSEFGVIFIGHSAPIPASVFTQADASHWVLDIGTAVSLDYLALKEVVLFLAAPLAPQYGLGLYIAMGDGSWAFRGFVASDHPSDVFPLQWPVPEPGEATALTQPGAIKLGIALEPLSELQQKEGSKLNAKADFAKLVALNLFHFMQSFGVQQAGDQLLVPANCIDRWFRKFSDRFRRDPDFLTREKAEL